MIDPVLRLRRSKAICGGGTIRGACANGAGKMGPRGKFARGFTLVEVMIAVVIFLMVTLGVYASLIRAYQLSALSRCRDEARAVLRSYADQFAQLQTTVLVSNVSQKRWLFMPTNGPSGLGMIWPGLSDKDATQVFTDSSPQNITLGGTGRTQHPIPATITRDIAYVDPTTGASTTSQTVTAAGYLIRGTFTINFTLNGTAHTQSMVVLRLVP